MTLVHIALAVPGSLSATYYEKNVADALGGLEVEGAGGEQVLEPAANRDSDLQVASLVTSGSFSVRYAGLVRPTLTTTYTFTAPNITASDERVRAAEARQRQIEARDRSVEQIQSHPDMGQRFLSYLASIDTQVE